MTPSLDYQLLTKLGESAASAAWLGRKPDSGVNALVRVFHGTLWRRLDARGHFVDRAGALQAIQHPNLARQLEAGCLPDGRPFVVSEYLEGEDLAAHLRRNGPLTPDQVALLVPAVCSALTELRSRGILVHALPAEQVFLVGGLSRFAPKLVGPGLADAPGDDADARADVAALGRLMREALGFGGGGWLEPIIRRCLEPVPTERFADPSALARALDAAQPRTQELRGRNTGATPMLLVEDEVREREGDILGQYRLERLLGEGSMGRVFLARHVTLGRPAAIKVLRAEHAQNQNLIQRFFHEARAVNQINHEHIVEILDFVHEPGPSGRTRVYCVMEMLEGHSLTQVLAHERLSVTRAVDIARQVARALGAAHQVGVVHRDVKPDNLFLVLRGSERDFVKVLDFGVAKLMTPLGDLPLSSTVEGTIVGTPAYMAPEQANGLGADARTDQYALGCVLHELLAGQPPFSGTSFGQLVAKVLTEPAPPLPARTPAGERIPAPLRAVVLRCLAKDPVDRFPTMQALESALAAALVPAPRRRRSRLLLPGLAAGLLLLAAGGLAALRLRPAAPAPVPAAEPAAAPVAAPEPAPADAAPPRGQEPSVPPAVAPPRMTLRVRSQPRGARVERTDTGEVLGTTPLSVQLAEESGTLPLRVSAPGRVPVLRRVPATGSVQLEVRLQPRRPAAVPAASPAPAPAPPPQPPVHPHQPDPFKL
ncbi:MAG TPA: protein kinase [Myxococcaceae bacterium]|nr:protein kinase [Myxococcaceae bacterium]